MTHETDQDIIEQQAEQAAETAAEHATEEGTAAEDTASAIEQEIAQLKLAAEENYQRYLRTQADFDNFRRRSRQEREDFAKYASQQLIEGLLPIVDNFERALQASREHSDFEALAKGVDMINRQLLQLLEQEGLTPIEALGQPFNPEYHQAVMQVEAEDGQESGIIVEEMQKGYMLKDKVIRPSMVKVSG